MQARFYVVRGLTLASKKPSSHQEETCCVDSITPVDQLHYGQIAPPKEISSDCVVGTKRSNNERATSISALKVDFPQVRVQFDHQRISDTNSYVECKSNPGTGSFLHQTKTAMGHSHTTLRPNLRLNLVFSLFPLPPNEKIIQSATLINSRNEHCSTYILSPSCIPSFLHWKKEELR